MFTSVVISLDAEPVVTVLVDPGCNESETVMVKMGNGSDHVPVFLPDLEAARKFAQALTEAVENPTYNK